MTSAPPETAGLPTPPRPDDGPAAELTRSERRRARRLAKWEHPPERSDWRYLIGAIGRVLIAAGVLMFGFIAYLLWGTGLETARAQRELSAQFDQLLETTPATAPTSAPTTGPTTDQASGPSTDDTPSTDGPDAETSSGPETAVDQNLGPFNAGDPVARLEIPSLGIDEIIVAGVGVPELKLGPGHFPETPLPGQFGRASVAGHRTTYGQPFRAIDRLEPGDQMIATTPAGRFVYEVTDSMVVEPSDYHVVNTTVPELANLTLVTCHPVFSSSQRLVVNALIVPEQSDPIGRTQPPGQASAGGLLPDELADEPADDASSVTGPTPRDDIGDAVNDGSETDVDPGVTPPDVFTDEVDEAGPAPDLVSLDEAFGGGWFDDPDAPAQVALWGGILAVIGAIGFMISRAARRDLIGFAVAIAPFAVASFFFFQNLQRLLPAGL